MASLFPAIRLFLLTKNSRRRPFDAGTDAGGDPRAGRRLFDADFPRG